MSIPCARLTADLRQQIKQTQSREVPRRRFGVNTSGLLTFPDGSRHVVLLADISTKGIGFYAATSMDRGTFLELELSRHADSLVKATAKVAHATAGTQDLWLIGCEFAKRLPSELVDKLIAQTCPNAS